MKPLHDIMTEMEATPSPDSWQKLSQRLDVVMPQTPTAPKTPHAAHLAGKAALKVVAAVVGTATVAAGITLAVVMSDKSENIDNQNNTTIVQDTVIEQEVASKNIENSYTVSNDEVRSEFTVSIDDTDLSEPELSTPFTRAANALSSQPSSIKPMAIAATPQQIAPIGTITLPSLTSIATSAQDDPALQNLDEEELQIEEPTKLEIPNVFTPNGDGVNDYFVIKGLEQCNIRELIVHNRAGNIVYRSSSYESQWNGDNCPDGVYYYQLTFDSHGIKRTATGSVTIIRK